MNDLGAQDYNITISGLSNLYFQQHNITLSEDQDGQIQFMRNNHLMTPQETSDDFQAFINNLVNTMPITDIANLAKSTVEVEIVTTSAGLKFVPKQPAPKESILTSYYNWFFGSKATAPEVKQAEEIKAENTTDTPKPAP